MSKLNAILTYAIKRNNESLIALTEDAILAVLAERAAS
jgi:hypothetical protein